MPYNYEKEDTYTIECLYEAVTRFSYPPNVEDNIRDFAMAILAELNKRK